MAFVYSDKGKKIADSYGNYFNEADSKKADVYRSELKEKEKKSSEALSKAWPDIEVEDIPDIMSGSFNDGLWEKVTENTGKQGKLWQKSGPKKKIR